MSEKFRIDRKIGFQNTFYTKYIHVIIYSIGPLIILRSIVSLIYHIKKLFEYKSITIFLPINLNMCFGYLKYLPH